MNSIQFIRAAVWTALLGSSVALTAHAQSAGPSTPGATAPAALTRGEVRKVDQDNHKITLKHDAIKNLDMPPMTMVFLVRDPALLDKVHVGDKVLFAAIQDAGKLTVTTIEPAK